MPITRTEAELQSAIETMFRVRAVESPPDEQGARTIWHRGHKGADMVTWVDAFGRVTRQELYLFDDCLVWEKASGVRTGESQEREGSKLNPAPGMIAFESRTRTTSGWCGPQGADRTAARTSSSSTRVSWWAVKSRPGRDQPAPQAGRVSERRARRGSGAAAGGPRGGAAGPDDLDDRRRRADRRGGAGVDVFLMGAESQRVARFGTTVFSEFSAWRASEGGQPRPGVPGLRRAGRGEAGGVGRDPGRSQSVRDGHGRRVLRASDRRALRCASTISASIPETMVRSPAERPRRSSTRVGRCSIRATRWCCSSRSTTRTSASVQMAGGVPRCVRLLPSRCEHATWWFDETELAAAFGPRTRLVFVNTPHNPTGKVFTRDELKLIASSAQRARRDGARRRGLRAPGLRTGARMCALATLPGMCGAHADDQQRRQDLLASPAGRSAGRSARRRW